MYHNLIESEITENYQIFFSVEIIIIILKIVIHSLAVARGVGTIKNNNRLTHQNSELFYICHCFVFVFCLIFLFAFFGTYARKMTTNGNRVKYEPSLCLDLLKNELTADPCIDEMLFLSENKNYTKCLWTLVFFKLCFVRFHWYVYCC